MSQATPGAFRRVVLAVLAFAHLVFAGGSARAEAPPDQDPVGIPSGLRPRAPKRAPTRHLRALAERPSSGISACSETRPICVHVEQRTPGATIERTLAAAERTFVTLDALKLPRPRFDGTRGGDGRFDIYLSQTVEDARVIADIGGSDAFSDATSAFAILPSTSRGGCDEAQRVARAIGEATLLGLDGAADRGVVSMSASYLATLANPCSSAEIEAVDVFQRAPDRCLVGMNASRVIAEESVTQVPEPESALHTAMPGSFLFPSFLDARFGAQGPGTIVASLFAVSAHKSPSGAPMWIDDPNFFDALRSTLRSQHTSFGQVMLDFAVDRAFMGSRSDGKHMDDVARFGELGRVRFEWSAQYSSMPRRLAPARPLDALGSTYIWLDLASAPPSAELTFVAEWEVPFLFRWALIKVDKSGADAGRIDVAPVFGQFRAEKTVRDIDGMAGILIVGVNDGEWSKAQPFDPGEPRLDPKSYLVTLYR